MKSYKKIAIGLLIVIALVACVCCYLILSMNFHSSEADLEKELVSIHTGATVQYHTNAAKTATTRYVRIPNLDKNAPILLTLHGAPGSCSDYSSYWTEEQLVQKFEIISVDRPGYGGSYMEGTNFSIAQQAEILTELAIDIAGDRGIMLLSHSYGGPVGVRLAIDLDSLCLGHVMVAPVIDPFSEEVFWYSPIPILSPFSWFSSTDWKAAALEKKTHIGQLETLLPLLKEVRSHTVHIHGTDDWLASIKNVPFAQKEFAEGLYNPIVIEEGSHFILWENTIQKMIIEQLLKLRVI